MKNKLILEYHLERKRERSGKVTAPAPYAFENIVEAYLRNSSEIDDLLIVPITINYDKVYEGYQFPDELLGEDRQELTFYRVMKSIFWINEKFGRVKVKYCKPISMKEKALEFLKERNLDLKLLKDYPILPMHSEELI